MITTDHKPIVFARLVKCYLNIKLEQSKMGNSNSWQVVLIVFSMEMCSADIGGCNCGNTNLVNALKDRVIMS